MENAELAKIPRLPGSRGPADAPPEARSLLLGAFGDPGHAFPMIALGERLAARGHRVTLQTGERWRPQVEAGAMTFSAAPEYQVFPTLDRPLKPYQAAVRAARDTVALVEASGADVVVSDILTLAPSLAGEMAGVPVATLVPHLLPITAPGQPPYSMSARLPRSAFGRRGWAALGPALDSALRRGRHELNETRARLGLAPLAHVHGGISRRLCLIATFPQLEYPRPWPPWARVVGPLLWEPPAAAVDPPDGDGPLVLVAPSTSQDRSHRLLRAALEGLADAPVRVLATWNRRPLDRPVSVPPNAKLVEWLSYSRAMPACDLVLCHGGHGTVARALASGAAVVACPNAGDMGENAARVDWAGVGVRLPWRLCTPAGVRLAVERALADPLIRPRARVLAAWATVHDAATRAAMEVEGLAGELGGGIGRLEM